jgi:cyclopropane-fatty-acyl-phospholipid synthase
MRHLSAHHWNGTVTTVGGQKRVYGNGADRRVAIRFTSYGWQWAVLFDPELRLGEACMDGGLVLDRGSIAEFQDLVARKFAWQEPAAWTKWLRKLRTQIRFVFGLDNLIRARRNSSAPCASVGDRGQAVWRADRDCARTRGG